MSDPVMGFLEEILPQRIEVSSFVSQPENDLSGFCIQPSQLDSSADSTYSPTFDNNLGGGGICTSDYDELLEEFDQLQKLALNSEMKWMSVGDYDPMLEGQSTSLAEEGQRVNRRRNWRLVESGNYEEDGEKSDWCLRQLVEGAGDVTMVSGQHLDASSTTKNVTGKTKTSETLQIVQLSNECPMDKDLDNKKFHCEGCFKLFASKQDAKRHVYSHMSKEELDKLQVAYQECHTCSKIFFQSGHFSRHQLVHSGIKSHFCGLCGIGFTQKQHLARHASVHLNPVEKAAIKLGWKTVCYFCHHKFKTTSLLFVHLSSHIKERAFGCDVCRQTFAKKSALTRHKKSVHEQRRQIFCEDCGKPFGTKRDLKYHSVVHSGARDFCCESCPKTFKRRSHLNVHLKSVHLRVKYN